MARTFDGVDDYVQFSVGNCNIAGGPITLVAIIRPTSTTRNVVLMGSEGLGDPAYLWSVGGADMTFYAGTGNEPLWMTCFVEWMLISVTVTAGGTTTPRGHVYRYSTNTWQHADASQATTTSGTASHSIWLGRWDDGGGPFTGDIAAAGVWNTALTDAQIESLPFSLQAWHSLSPRGLWVLDQSATTQAVADLTGGGANQSSLGGTTVSTNSVPVFNYGNGAGPVLAIHGPPISLEHLRPDSDITRINWVNESAGTTNLWQSIDESGAANDSDYVTVSV